MEEEVFQIANTLALLSWIVLIFFPFKENTSKYLVGIVVFSLALLYTSIIIASLSENSEGGFGSLAQVMELFSNKKAVLAGWIHYLAFDLMVGLYIANNGRKLGFKAWQLIPSFILTFMFGPIGLMSYIILRLFKAGRFFHVYN